MASPRKTALSVRIAGTGSVPGRPVTTAELVAQVPGTWDATRIATRTGIAARHFVAPGTTAAALGAAALRQALASAPFGSSKPAPRVLPPRRSRHALRGV